MDPDPDLGGPKTYGSDGSGSARLFESVPDNSGIVEFAHLPGQADRPLVLDL